MSLQVRNLHIKSKEGKEILRNVSLELNKGDVIVIMGKNGSGKSTLINVIAGNEEYEITSGDILLDGDSIKSKDARERGEEGIFVIFQHPILLEGVKVGNLLYEMYKKKYPNTNINEFKQYISKMLRNVGLKKEILTKYMDSSLSGGERKRIELIMLYLLDPMYIFLDEIDSGMDVEGIKLVAKIIKECKERGKGVGVVTHYPSLVERLLHVIDRGYVLEDGEVRRVYKNISEMLKDVKERGYAE